LSGAPGIATVVRRLKSAPPTLETEDDRVVASTGRLPAPQPVEAIETAIKNGEKRASSIVLRIGRSPATRAERMSGLFRSACLRSVASLIQED